MSENQKSDSGHDLDEKSSEIRKAKRIFSLIEKCKILRLDKVESVKFCNENNWRCTRGLFLKWCVKYEKNTDDKWAELAKYDSAEQILESIDHIKEQQRLLWASLADAESTIDAMHILDSLRGLSEDILTLYNDAALLRKMREVVDQEIKRQNSLK